MKLEKIIQSTVCTLSAVFVAYVVACVVDVNVHNLTDFTYSWWNIFRLV
jgi:hypothetical protein